MADMACCTKKITLSLARWFFPDMGSICGSMHCSVFGRGAACGLWGGVCEAFPENHQGSFSQEELVDQSCWSCRVCCAAGVPAVQGEIVQSVMGYRFHEIVVVVVANASFESHISVGGFCPLWVRPSLIPDHLSAPGAVVDVGSYSNHTTGAHVVRRRYLHCSRAAHAAKDLNGSDGACNEVHAGRGNVRVGGGIG